VYGTATDEFPDGTNPISKPNSAWVCCIQLKLWPFFWFFWPILAKIWLPWQRPLDPCNDKSLLWISPPRKPTVISNRIQVISRSRKAFMCIYRNFCPKIGCHGNPPLSPVYASVTAEFTDGTNPIPKLNSACMWLTAEVMAIFVIFWPILAKIWLPWQRPLDPCNQKCLLWIDWPRKPFVMSNHVLVISHRSAFICNYSNFCPKIGCHGNAPLSPMYGSVTDKFIDSTNPISKPNSAWICSIQLVMAIFVIF